MHERTRTSPSSYSNNSVSGNPGSIHEVDSGLLVARTNNSLLDLIETILFSANLRQIFLPRSVGGDKSQRLVDVPYRFRFVMLVNQLYGIRVISVDPERKLLGPRETRGIKGRQLVEISLKFGRLLECAVVHKPVGNMGFEQRVERRVIK